MIPGDFRFSFRRGFAPLLPGKETDARLLTVPGGDGFGVSRHRNGAARDGVKALPLGIDPVRERANETLRDVGRVHVMQRFAAQVRQGNFASRGQIPEYPGSEIRRWIQRDPSLTDEMAGMNDNARNIV